MALAKIASSLLLKSNRSLAAQLVDTGLVSLKDMDTANEVFIEHVRRKDAMRASLLRILLFEKQSLTEASLLDHLFSHHRYAGVHLQSYQIQESSYSVFPPENIVATWSLPIDRVGDTTFIASAYLLSEVVRKHWEEQVDGSIIWYATPLADLEHFFQTVFIDVSHEKEEG
jgi:hypothetical protein